MIFKDMIQGLQKLNRMNICANLEAIIYLTLNLKVVFTRCINPTNPQDRGATVRKDWRS